MTRSPNAKAAGVLRQALALLDGGKAWTKGKIARSSSGIAVLPESPNAASWCAIGAIGAAATTLTEYESAMRYLRKVHLYTDVKLPTDPQDSVYNDFPSTTFTQVQERFEAAIRLAEEPGSAESENTETESEER